MGAAAQEPVLNSVAEIYPNSTPYQVNFTYDSQDRLTKVTNNEYTRESYTFDWTGYATGKMSYKFEDTDSPENNTVYDVTLNANGYADKIVENDQDGSTVYTFKYDTDGYMTQVSILGDGEEGPEVYDITYTAGSITSILYTDKRVAAELESYTIAVTPSDIPAKGCLAMYDDIYQIDLDNADLAARAGLLGKVPAMLPAKVDNTTEKDTYTYVWTVNTEGYPTALKSTEVYDGETSETNYTFNWGKNAGINAVQAEADGVEAIYGLDGIRRNSLQQGINLVRRADGTVAKVLVK